MPEGGTSILGERKDAFRAGTQEESQRVTVLRSTATYSGSKGMFSPGK